VSLSDGTQALVQFHQGLADELDPAVGGQAAFDQWIQDLGVEDEHAPDLPAGLERVVQRRIVLGAQVTPEPHQASVVGVHAGEPGAAA